MRSKGEQEIEQLLIQHNIKFKREFKIRECADKKPLPFDFALFNDKGELVCLCEFDGAQHFNENKKFGHKATSNTKWHDFIKNKYCLTHNIPLIRIPYWKLGNIRLDEILPGSEFRVYSLYHNEQYFMKGR